MKKVEFPVPAGYTPPEGMNQFDVMCTLQLKPGGKTMCLVGIQGVPLPGYGDKNEGPKDYGTEAGTRAKARYAQAMTGMEGGAVGGGGMAY